MQHFTLRFGACHDPRYAAEFRAEVVQLVLRGQESVSQVCKEYVLAFIARKTGRYPVAWMCRRLGVSTSGYYAWRGRPPSKRAAQDAQLSLRIKAIHRKYGGRYGRPRIYDELRDRIGCG